MRRPPPSTAAPRPARSQLTIEDAEALVDPVLAPDVGLVAPVVSPQSITATVQRRHPHRHDVHRHVAQLPDDQQQHRAGRGAVHRLRLPGAAPGRAARPHRREGPRRRRRPLDRGADRAVQRRGVRGDRRPRGQGQPGAPGPRRRRDRPADGRAGHPRELRQPVVHRRAGHRVGPGEQRAGPDLGDPRRAPPRHARQRRFHDLQPELDPGRRSTRSPARSRCCSGRWPGSRCSSAGSGS